MHIPDRLRARVLWAVLGLALVGAGRLEAQASRPLTVRVQVVQAGVTGAVLSAGRALVAGRGAGRPTRADVGVATVAVAFDRRAVLTIQYFRN